MNFKLVALLSTLVLVASCTTLLTSEGDKIQIITASQKESCERTTVISTWSDAGSKAVSSALNKAMNEAALSGADSLYILSQNVGWLTGATVTGEAMKCDQS